MHLLGFIQIAYFDSTSNDAAEWTVVKPFVAGSETDMEVTGRILAGNTTLELIDQFSLYAGRMQPLPEWIMSGAVVGCVKEI